MAVTFHRFLPDGHPETGMGPSHAVPATAFTTDDRSELRHKFFETADGSITSGVWECAPILVEIDAYSVNELMTVLSGSLDITDAQGRRETFTAGDTFLIPKGAKVTLEITERLRKFYMIVT
ncbi:cupin domain-containing protein [Pelagibius marinus]|uniref:cupin domain-containing protein n=1 Tax=Pelagibius marinus TaxID=2762760 RepID=UPI001872CFAC|nr:cupin domain-containing protein [Pelagibius marinus]